jgi:antitoxin component YwqK of YwqJK toxin-antitoxin module
MRELLFVMFVAELGEPPYYSVQTVFHRHCRWFVGFNVFFAFLSGLAVLFVGYFGGVGFTLPELSDAFGVAPLILAALAGMFWTFALLMSEKGYIHNATFSFTRYRFGSYLFLLLAPISPLVIASLFTVKGLGESFVRIFEGLLTLAPIPYAIIGVTCFLYWGEERARRGSVPKIVIFPFVFLWTVLWPIGLGFKWHQKPSVTQPKLIKCDGCGNQVSSAEEACSNCSHPIADSVDAYVEARMEEQKRVAEEKRREHSRRLDRKIEKLEKENAARKRAKERAKEIERKYGKIIAEAIDDDGRPSDYTGWVKKMYDNGQIRVLMQVKDGKTDGLEMEWYSNGQKSSEETHKDGKLITAVAWKPNGEKCPVTNVKNGNGVFVQYWKDGTEGLRSTFKDGEVVDEDDEDGEYGED